MSNMTYRKSDHIVVIEIAAPGVGPSLPEAAWEFSDLCERVAWDSEVRVVVVVFDGNGHPFEAAIPARPDPGGQPSLVEAAAGIRQPVIAAIRGDATGPGLEFSLACDIRIGAEGAGFGLPAVAQGSMPSAGGTQRLPRLVGQGRALEMILTGEMVSSEEALRIGLINRVVPPDKVTDAAMSLAGDIAGKSPLATVSAKEALHKGLDLTIDQGLRMELDLYLLLFNTADRAEGINAFKEKRKPRFEGK